MLSTVAARLQLTLNQCAFQRARNLRQFYGVKRATAVFFFFLLLLCFSLPAGALNKFFIVNQRSSRPGLRPITAGGEGRGRLGVNNEVCIYA